MLLMFCLCTMVFISRSDELDDETIMTVLNKLSVLEKTVTGQQEEIIRLGKKELVLLERVKALEILNSKYISLENDKKNGIMETTGKTVGTISKMNAIYSFSEPVYTKPIIFPNLTKSEVLKVHQKRAPTAVAFYAYMSSGEPNTGQHHILVFDHVITNVDNAYNKFTGVFAVHATGLYVLTVTLSGSPSSQIPIEFIRNDEVLGSIQLYSSVISPDTNPTASSTIVVSLTKGDSCFVRTSLKYTTAGSIYSTDLSRSSFAGWLVSLSS